MAVLYGEDCEPDPEHWYRERFDSSPDYSELLEGLLKSPAERQQLLRTYWEPSGEERQEGLKLPTAAHRAIAALVSQGFVRIIVTTNFDRLFESALAEAGVVPVVLSSPDQVHGALPLIHTQCCVFKVHGDYLDTRIRNTPTELSAYPPEFDRLLDRILDEFGLIVCGWSAGWDAALRSAILRAPSRRFWTYWVSRGEPGNEARSLIEHRGAQVITIKDADTFFQSVQRYVESLEEFARPHPLSTEAAVASLKRYLAEHRYRIQLADLIDEEVERVVQATTGDFYVVENAPEPTVETATARVRGYEAACSTLLAMALVGGYWGEEHHIPVWKRALQRLSAVTPSTGGQWLLWVGLRRYPATLLLYGLGLGAVEGGRLGLLQPLFATSIHQEYRDEKAAVELLPPFCLFGDKPNCAAILEGMEGRYAPLNDWLHELLRQNTRRLIPEDDEYTLIFDEFEILIALGFVHLNRDREWDWAPAGAFGHRSLSRVRILEEIQRSIETEKERSPFVASGIFGDSVDSCTQALGTFQRVVEKISRTRW